MTPQELFAAADRLDAEGNHELAAEARREAVAPAPEPLRTVAIRCDECNGAVSARQARKYETWVDWALCSRCEGRR